MDAGGADQGIAQCIGWVRFCSFAGDGLAKHRTNARSQAMSSFIISLSLDLAQVFEDQWRGNLVQFAPWRAYQQSTSDDQQAFHAIGREETALGKLNLIKRFNRMTWDKAGYEKWCPPHGLEPRTY